MKRLAMLVVILMVSACAPAVPPGLTYEQQWLNDMFERDSARNERWTKLVKNDQLGDQLAQEWNVKTRKWIAEESPFYNTLSEKERQAYNDYQQALDGKDNAGVIIARGKLENLLRRSGKLNAFEKIDPDLKAWVAMDKANLKKMKELGNQAEVLAEQVRTDQENEKMEMEMNRERVNDEQQFMLQQSLQNIGDALDRLNFDHPGKY